jgi:hypothetical protein
MVKNMFVRILLEATIETEYQSIEMTNETFNCFNLFSLQLLPSQTKVAF